MKEMIKTSLSRKVFTLITLCLSVGILVFFLFATDGVKTLWHIARRLEPVWLIYAFAAIVGRWVLEGYTLHLLCRHIDPRWKFRNSFTVGMVGFLYSALTPFSAGEPVEIYSLGRMGMDLGPASSVVTIKALSYQVVMLFYSLFFVVMRLEYFRSILSNVALVVLITLVINGVFIGAILLFILNEKLTTKLLKVFVGLLHRLRLSKHPRIRYKTWRAQLLLFHNSSNTMGRSTALYVKSIIWTLVQITLSSVIPYFIYRSFGLRGDSFFNMLAADTFVSMAATFIPLPGSSGGAEGGFFLFFHNAFGSFVIPAILLWRLLTYYSSIVFGCLTTYIARKKHIM